MEVIAHLHGVTVKADEGEVLRLPVERFKVDLKDLRTHTPKFEDIGQGRARRT